CRLLRAERRPRAKLTRDDGRAEITQLGTRRPTHRIKKIVVPKLNQTGRSSGLNHRLGETDDIGPAVAVARRNEDGGEVIAAQSDLGVMRAVADTECPARARARIGWAPDRGETDVSQVESILSGHAGNRARKARRLIQLKDAG